MPGDGLSVATVPSFVRSAVGTAVLASMDVQPAPLSALSASGNLLPRTSSSFTLPDDTDSVMVLPGATSVNCCLSCATTRPAGWLVSTITCLACSPNVCNLLTASL